MKTFPFFHRQVTEREARLLAVDSDPFLKRVFNAVAGPGSAPDFLDPALARERDLISNRNQLSAFESPDIFTAPVDPSLAGTGGNKENLLSMTPERRLEEFTKFVNEQIPAASRNRFHTELFNTALGSADLTAYDTLDPTGRIRTLVSTLKILFGDTVTDAPPLATALADNVIKTKEIASPGILGRLYEQFLDNLPTSLSKSDATSPEILLRPNSGISDALRARLNFIPAPDRRTELESLYKAYVSKKTNNNLASLNANVLESQLSGSIQRKEIERQGRGFMENFTNASPALQIGAIGVGLFLGLPLVFGKDKEGKLKHPFLFGGALAALGYFGYDRFVNGNENAFDDMGRNLQSFVGFGGTQLKNVGKALGLPIPKDKIEELDIMGEFLSKNHLGFGPVQNGMAALAQINLGLIATAFKPDESGNIGGMFSVDTTDKQNLLTKALKKTLQGNSSEKARTLEILCTNNISISKALAHVFYLIGANETENLDDAERIDTAIVENAGSPDKLSNELKKDYMRISIAGQKLVKERPELTTISFVNIIGNLNTRRDREAQRKPDNAKEIPDPTTSRPLEFAALKSLKEAEVTGVVRSDILNDVGIIQDDYTEFLQNCETSGILNADASAALLERFTVIRTTTNIPLTDALEAIEKLKYAVLVQSTQKESTLTKDDILSIAGDTSYFDDLVTKTSSFLSLTHGFHTVSSMSDIRSLLREPWFGSGPVSSAGEGFTKLNERLTIYEKQFANMRNLPAVAKELTRKLDPTVKSTFDATSPGKAEAFVLSLLQKSSYLERVGSTEAQLGQRMANALARTMRLRDTGTAFGSFDELGITPIEQKNLKIEFDKLFDEVANSSTAIAESMWQKSEDIDLLAKFDIGTLSGYDYTTEPNRVAIIQYARDLALMHGLRVLSGRPEEPLRLNLLARFTEIRRNMSLMKIQNIIDPTRIFGPTLSPESFAELDNLELLLSA